MSAELYASIYIRQFPLQSWLRLRPELRAAPLAIMEGRAPLESVCSINRPAHRLGAAIGMTRVEAEAIHGLSLLSRSPEIEATASDVILECAANYSPRIELQTGNAHRACLLDIAGMERLLGSAQIIAQRLHQALTRLGFDAAVVISENFHTALLKSTAITGTCVIPRGHEATSLEQLPLDVLALPQKESDTLAAWGIRSLGALARLPEEELIARLGQNGKQWRDMARGQLPHLFQPIEPKLSLKEHYEFEPAIEHMDSLLFIAARMIDNLAARATERALVLASLEASLHLGKRVHTLVIRPALPTIDRKFLLKLLQIELSSHPPPAAVTALSIEAHAGHGSKVQLGLFSPQLPEPSRLDVTLARLKAIVGDDRVGSPVLEDTHNSHGHHIEAFCLTDSSKKEYIHHPRMALRRMRPPHPVQVRCAGQQPVAFHDGHRLYSIFAAYGPWKTSGSWWALEEWDRDEWDVLIAQEQELYLLVNDRRQSRWYLDAVYD